MLKLKFKNLSILVFTIILTLGFSISLQSLLAAWTAPTTEAPGNNTPTPINVGSEGQYKKAGLVLNAGVLDEIDENGLLVKSGNVGIGTLNPWSKLDVKGNAYIGSKDYSLGIADLGNGKITLFGWNGVNHVPVEIRANPGPQLYLSTDGNIGIGTTSPSTALDIGQNKALRIGNAYLSSGGNFAHLANNEWYNGAAWQTNGTPGALLQLNGQSMVVYNHNGAGGHTAEAVINPSGLTVYGSINATGDICGGGKCLSSAGGNFGGMFTIEDEFSLGNTSYSHINPVTGNFSCPAGFNAYPAIRSRHSESSWGQWTYFCYK